jgi:hypothetical protein
MSTDRERNVVSQMYDNYTWHERVAAMSNEQVIAIYLRFMRDGYKPPQEIPVRKPIIPPDPQGKLF